jgi:phosphatidate cytidylyltransferase
MKPLALALSALLAGPSWAAGGVSLLPGPAPAPWCLSFSSFSDWLTEPAAMNLTAGIDPYLADYKTFEPEAIAPIAERIRADGGEAAFLRSLSNISSLPRAEQARIVKVLSVARKAAAGDVASRLLLAADAVRAGRIAYDDAVRLTGRSWIFRLYGYEGEKGLFELQSAAADVRMERMRARARLLGPAVAVDAGESDASPLAPPQQPQKKKSDLLPRAATAAVLAPSLIGLIHVGGWPFAGLVTAIAGLSNMEYGKLLLSGGRPVQRAMAIVSGSLLALAPALGVPLAPVLAASAAGAVLTELFRKDHNFERAALTLFGAVMFGFLPAHLILVRAWSPHGEALAYWVFTSAWVSDSLGYIVGKPFGRRKIAPVVSPGKTWEGTLAGLAGSLGVSAAFWAMVPGLMSLSSALALGALLGVSGQVSGFINSMIKRAVGAKDSGKLLPGHGGVLDRFDSFLLSAAVAYYFLLFAL